jgi:predicted metal-dependent enzyme (double-stranded beta helix superfamily)
MPNHRFNVSRRRILLGGCAIAAGATLARGEVPPAARAANTARKFDPERFVDDCKAAARAGGEAQARIQELLTQEISQRNAMLDELGEPTKGGLKALYQSPELTILNIVWSPLMQLLPHEHNMWAVIGIYTGREDNIFWQRGTGRLSAASATAISAGDVVPLAHDVIHSVSNPIEKLTGAIHIYGGDFFRVHRSEWNPETLEERPWSIRDAVRNFEQSNARFFGPSKRDCAPRSG